MKNETKKAKKEKCREIIQKYNDLEFISPEDRSYMIWIFQNHPWYKLKAGSGIDQIFIKENKPWLTRGFWIRRKNGTVTEISFLEAISGKATPEQAFKMCLREAAGIQEKRHQDFINNNQYGNLRQCANCFSLIPKEEAVLKPKRKIRELIRFFIIEKEFTDFESLIIEDETKLTGYRIIDINIISSWTRFFNNSSSYSILCKKCNMEVF